MTNPVVRIHGTVNDRSKGEGENSAKNIMKKHPKWPQDLCRQALVVGEEAGELQQAVLNSVEYSEAGWDIDFAPDRLHYDKLQSRIDEEAVQVAAMALRFLLARR